MGRTTGIARAVEPVTRSQRGRYRILDLGMDRGLVEELRYRAFTSCLRDLGRQETGRDCTVPCRRDPNLWKNVEAVASDRRRFARLRLSRLFCGSRSRSRSDRELRLLSDESAEDIRLDRTARTAQRLALC